jgi:uncharacterized protein
MVILQSMETNEELLKFPCEFHIKAIGHTTQDFDTKVISVVRKHIRTLYEGAVKSKLSSKGRYSSVTVSFTVDSRKQLDTIYTSLGALDEVVMVL